MKTTLDLPEDLVRAVEFQARQEGRKLNDAAADLLRKGLAASTVPPPQLAANGSARIKIDPATGLPIILGDAQAQAGEMTIIELLALEQATQTEEDLGLSP